MNTPKIIWQTWKDKKNIPSNLYKYTLLWKKLHPSYKYILLDDGDLRDIIKQTVPQYLNLYDSFTHNIERVDFARYALLYKHGGIYADLDTEPLKNIDVFVEKNKIILGCEPKEHAEKIYKRDRVVCNALMISPPEQTFWLDLMRYISDRYEHRYKPVDNTGPLAITKFLETSKKYEDQIIITDPCVFFPIVNDGSVSRECNIEKQSYVKHIWQNSWTDVWYKDPMWFNIRYWTIGLSILFLVMWVWCYLKISN